MDPSLKKKQLPYFYSITGDAMLGDNKTAKEYSQEGARFPMGTRGAILTQSGGWKQVTGEITPMYAPGVVQTKFAMGKHTPDPSNG